MTSKITSFAGILIISIVAVVGFSAAYAGSGVPVHTTEEITLTDSGSFVDQRDALRYRDNETVVYNGSTLAEGSDYSWNTSTGELTRLSGSSAPDGATVNIEYAYAEPSETTRGINKTLSSGGQALPVIVLFLGIAAIWGWLS
ncbi:hypothetical protein C5B91_20170 [Haloferax sp. Atlit-10N]|uniref:hypothetical protein n=1 Tax=unclassified Haloferax TaxID=2625095 RepID=UPI000E26C7BF|nr:MULTISPECIES: hypothetical protein [unclassified Haloferax]RDZ39411.1 hypothetical protein C5B87_19430 [Haloferax sp. Atlit-16N]RDZ53926.1 hypothetical protein C5B91_20170 [Haloferax sp. Atlit-10N]